MAGLPPRHSCAGLTLSNPGHPVSAGGFICRRQDGVDIPEGKNLVGAFWQPALVIADTDTLDTLPAMCLRTGWRK